MNSESANRRVEECALELVSQGYPVFPCLASKRPATPHGHLEATNDPREVERLWRRYPRPLIGVRTGEASSFAVLDIDIKSGGLDWLEENFDHLPKTRVHATRSGGFHILLQHKPGLRCSAGKIALGVDVRADGGYIIWWPAAGLDVLRDAPLATWPDWLAPPKHEVRFVAGGAASGIRILTDKNLASIIAVAAGAADGQRNSSLYWAACRLGEQVRIGVMAEGDALARLIRAGMEAGLDEQEAERSARSGLRHVR